MAVSELRAGFVAGTRFECAHFATGSDASRLDRWEDVLDEHSQTNKECVTVNGAGDIYVERARGD